MARTRGVGGTRTVDRPTKRLVIPGAPVVFQLPVGGAVVGFDYDAGSTVALTDASGNSQVQYSYSPHGSVNITGTTNNSYTYTGREMDGLGIYRGIGKITKKHIEFA